MPLTVDYAEQPTAPVATPPQAPPTGGLQIQETVPLDPGLLVEDQHSQATLWDDLTRKVQSFRNSAESTTRGVLQYYGELSEQINRVAPAIRGGSMDFSSLKLLDRALELNDVWTPPVENPTFLDKLAGGVGSAASFAPAGLLAPSLVAGTGVSGLLGGVVGGGLQVMDAEAYNATEEEQFASLIGGTIFGSTEAISGGYFLNKLNKASGGKLWRVLGEVGGVKAPAGVLRDTIKGFLGEGAQEGFQTWGENFVAAEFAGYHPERAPGEGVGEAALIGAIIGGGLGGGLGYVQDRAYQKDLAKKKEAYDALMASGDPINSFVGEMLPLYNMPELQEEFKALDQAFKKNADEALALLEQGQFPGLNKAFGIAQYAQDIPTDKAGEVTYRGQVDQRPGLEEVMAGQAQILGDPTTRLLSKQSPLPDTSVRGVLEQTDARTVLAEPRVHKKELEDLTTLMMMEKVELDKIFQEVGALQAAKITVATELLAAKADQQHLFLAAKKKVDLLKRRMKIEELMLRRVADVVRKFVGPLDYGQATGTQIVAPEVAPRPPMRFIVQSGVLGDAGDFSNPRAAATMGMLKDIKNKGVEQEVGLLELNLQPLLDKMAPSDPYAARGSQDEIRQQFALLQERVFHEIGHAYVAKYFEQTKAAAEKFKKTGKASLTPEELELAKTNLGIFLGYRRFINEQLSSATKSKEEFLAAGRGLASAVEHQGRMDQVPSGDGVVASMKPREKFSARQDAFAGQPLFTKKGAAETKNYTFSFNEYLAHQFERAAARGKLDPATGQPIVENDLQRVMKKHFFSKLEGIHRSMLQTLKSDPKSARGLVKGYQPMEIFIKRLVVNREIQNLLEKINKKGPQTLTDALRGEIPGMDPKNWAGLQEHLDTMNKTHQYWWNLLQTARYNTHIQGLQSYTNAVANQWAPYARKFFDQAHNTLKAWRRLGKEANNKISNVLLEETENEELFSPVELKKRLTDAEAEVYFEIRKDLANVLSEMKRVAIQQAQTNLYGDQVTLTNALNEIEETFGKMENKGYFPYMRFGKHLMRVRASEDTNINGRLYKKGQLVMWETFDWEHERDKAVKNWQGRGLKILVSPGTLSDQQFAVQALPLPLLRNLKDKLVAGGMPMKDLVAVNEALENALPLNSFRRHFTKRRGIEGFSRDLQRSYAAYMRMSASHLSRIENSDAMLSAISQVNDDVKILEVLGSSTVVRDRILDWMRGHYQYIMNPQNELQGLRSFFFMYYLGFNVKSAVLNLMQPITVGLPYMAGRFGDVLALKHMALAQKDLASLSLKPQSWIQSAINQELRPITYAQLAGEKVFVMEGTSSQYDVTAQKGKYYDLSKLKLGNTNDPGMVPKLLEVRTRLEKRKVLPDQNTLLLLDAAKQKFQASPGVLTRAEFDQLGLEATLSESNLDGVILEAAPGETQVFVPNKAVEKLTISQKEAALRKETKPNERKGEIVRMLQRLQAEGVTDQSLAMELAIASSENKVDRLAPLNAAQLTWYKASEWGSLPFHLAEKLNRRMMTIAAYNAARELGMSEGRAQIEAREAVRQSMYEHANWNRPRFMRGKQSAAFLFMNYVQNTVDVALRGDKMAARFWLQMLLLAGIMGLPGAQDAEDLIDFSLTRLKNFLGMKNPKVQIRQELRSFLSEMNLNPDLMLHGLAQQSFGLPMISEQLGIPFPSVDMSGSIGLGNVLPGTGVPQAFAERGVEAGIAKAVVEFGGAGAAATEQAMRGLFSNDPNSWKRVEKWFPAAGKGASKAASMWQTGEVKTATGDVVAKFNPLDPADRMEIALQGLSFTPTRVSRGWESLLAQRDLVEFYKRKQAMIVKSYAHAIYTQDRETIADTWKQLQAHQESVPFPEMKITADSLADSVEAYIKSQTMHKLGEGESIKYRRLRKEIADRYANPEGEDSVGTP